VAGARQDAGLASTGPVLVNLNNLYKVSNKTEKKKVQTQNAASASMRQALLLVWVKIEEAELQKRLIFFLSWRKGKKVQKQNAASASTHAAELLLINPVTAKPATAIYASWYLATPDFTKCGTR
jgi:hypothetical protein